MFSPYKKWTTQILYLNIEALALIRGFSMKVWLILALRGIPTWIRGKESETFIGAHLDKALCTTNFLNMFLEIKVNHLHALNFDHAPLFVNLERKYSLVKGGFKF